MALFDSSTPATVDTPAERVNNQQEHTLIPAGTPNVPNALTDLLGDFGVHYPNAPAPSPALLAFMNGLGMTWDEAIETRDTGMGLLERRRTDATQKLDVSAKRGERNVVGDLASRNMIKSGEANRRISEHAQDVGFARGDIERGYTEGATALETALRDVQGNVRTGALDRVLGHETKVETDKATASANEDYWKRMEEADDKSWARTQEALTNATNTEIDFWKKLYGGGG